MLRAVQRFINRDERGNVIVAFALALFPLLGFAGAAIDYSRLTLTHSSLQSAADAAALAGAKAMFANAGQTATTQETAAKTAATAVAGGMAPTAVPNITATASARTVNVRLDQTETIMFAAFVGKDTSTVGVESTATFNTQKDCIILLEASSRNLLLNSSSKLNSNCGLRANSTSSQAIQVNSLSSLKARSTCVVGGVFLNGGTIDPAAQTGCAKATDPLASLAEPPEATNACQYPDTVVQAGKSKTLSPGVYCTKFDVNGGTATLNPGIYIIRNVPLVVNSGGKVIGDDVMLFFMGKDGRLVLSSDSTMDVSGRKSGAYQGMVMFQSRDPITLQTAVHQFNGNSGMKTTGTIYMPNGRVSFNSGGTSSLTAPWTVFVVRELQLNSDAHVNVNTSYGSGPPLPKALEGLASGEGVRLIK